MKPLFPSILVALIATTVGCAAAPAPNSAQLEVKAQMQRVADWQIKNLHNDYNRVHKHDDRLVAWTYGALYVGMFKWAELTGDDTYFNFLRDIGDELNWKLGWGKFHADEHVVGQMYLDMFRKYNEPKMLENTKARIEAIRDEPSTQPMRLGNYEFSERWTWCDALFMAPPVWAKLSAITGDPSYRDWMFAEYQATTEHLYDPETHLFFRDNNFIERRAHNKKIFWARGNGWVFASLPLVIQELPEGAQRDWFINLYQEMAPALADLQTNEGHWAMSLLAADIYPTPETSGTAFFCYGLAWGINQGLLDRETYDLVAIKAWDSLTSHIAEDGMLGYVQPVGAAPGDASADKTEVYGTGAFLLAGSEVYRMLGDK
ncbi:MAG: glycoside hydrolase family 88/105 protein [Opitutaceae bacterium]